MYARWAPKPELKDWIFQNISEDIRLAGVQIITDDVPMHCDKRKWALNYLVETGGDQVITGFFKLRGQPTVQPPAARAKYVLGAEEIVKTTFVTGRWHLLNTNVMHSVVGVTGRRVAITVGFNEDNPFDCIKGYQGLASF